MRKKPPTVSMRVITSVLQISPQGNRSSSSEGAWCKNDQEVAFQGQILGTVVFCSALNCSAAKKNKASIRQQVFICSFI